MKNILAAALMVPAVVLAESDSSNSVTKHTKTVVCAATAQLMKEINGVKEIPFWAGKDKNSYYGLFVNEKTREWTLVQFNENVACVLGVGGKHTHIFVPNS